ncbi:MAG TPA: energy transducer TonB [Pyrinomonadaceae bacterium]|nr:energy transducer TonB [Pyrinomonadaceae bacterium]
MKCRTVCVSILPLLLLSISVAGQFVRLKRPALAVRTGVETHSDGLFVVGEVKGTVLSKAVILPKPDYPAEARWAGAEGIVRVQVTVDQEGNVAKAEALSGDAALIGPAEDAARRTKFRIARNENGQPIEVTGVLAYSFEIKKAGWSVIGYGLSGLARFPAFTFSIPTTRKAMATDWAKEREMLGKLDEIRRSEPPLQLPGFERASQVTMTNGSVTRSTISGRVTIPPRPSTEQQTLASDLISALKLRLAPDKLSLWQLDLGQNLRTAFDKYHNPYERAGASRVIKNCIETAPAAVQPEILAALKDIEVLFGKANDSIRMYEELNKPMSVIFNAN